MTERTGNYQRLTVYLPDWRGQWDEIGDRPTRLAYLRQYWPDLLAAIEAEARASLDVALRRLMAYADAAAECPYPMHDPEQCDHRAILRDEVAGARAFLERVDGV